MIKKLGSHHELFLSSRVTHHITAHGSQSTQKKPSPVKREVNVFRDATPAANGSELNVKVWAVDKLNEVLSTLLGLPKQSPARALSANLSLRTLLEDERLHGTRERDSTARRADHYYFAPGNCYLLVEDATAEHRPIMIKEYERPRQKDEVTPWPVLHETFLRPSREASAAKTSVVDLRAQAWRTYVERAPQTSARPIVPLRSSAVAALDKQLAQPTRQESLVPYQAASGNSVVLTSTIASTSNAHLSGGTATGPSVFGEGCGAAAYAQGRDKRLVDMSKRVQVLKGNFIKNAGGRKAVSQIPTVVSPAKRIESLEPETDYAMEDAMTRAEEDAGAEQRDDEMDEDAADGGGDYEVEGGTGRNQASAQPSMDSRVKSRVLALLLQAKTDAAWKRPDDIERVWEYCKKNHYRLQKDRTQQPLPPPKPGYCENCRVKYEDIDVHVRSRRHTKFAQNADNFTDLDALLQRLARPLRNSETGLSEDSSDCGAWD